MFYFLHIREKITIRSFGSVEINFLNSTLACVSHFSSFCELSYLSLYSHCSLVSLSWCAFPSSFRFLMSALSGQRFLFNQEYYLLLLLSPSSLLGSPMQCSLVGMPWMFCLCW